MKATLTYHSIDDSGSPISISPETFTAHMEWLTRGKVRVLPLNVLATDAGDTDAVAVTFDDGFLNTREWVDRLLAHQVPVTIFVVSGHVGKANDWGTHGYAGIPALPLLGWDDLEQLVSRGAMVGSHTRTHAALTRISSAALDDELLGAREDVRARLGVEPADLAYPYGDMNDAVSARASHYFGRGHTTDLRVLKDGEDPLRLPRLDMYYFRASGALESWGTRRFLRRLAWCRTRRALRARLMQA